MQCNPFITREKLGRHKSRVIVDPSWPAGNAANDGVCQDSYLGTEFILTFPSVDDTTEKVTRLGKSCFFLYKVDFSRAFHHIKIDPKDYSKLRLNWGTTTLILACLLDSNLEVIFFGVTLLGK